MIDLNKFSNTDRAKMFHSSGHAQLYRRGFGKATDRKAGTFHQKQEQSARQSVSGYSSSRLVRSDRFSDPSESLNRYAGRRPHANNDSQEQSRHHSETSRQEFNSRGGSRFTQVTTQSGQDVSRHHFKEPTTPKYDPFA